MRKLAAAMLALAFGGCTTGPRYLDDIDLSGRERACVDRCLGIFNNCAGTGLGIPTYQIEECKRSLRPCLDNNCPKL